MKINTRLIIISILCVSLFTGCGSDYEGGLRTGPTVTKAPTATPVPDDRIDMTDEEILKVLQEVDKRVDLISTEYDFEITDDMKAEKSEHGAGESEVYVYDSSDNLIAVLIYTDYVIEQANIDHYENGVLMYGTIYKNGTLDSYYETAECNGYFRTDMTFDENSSRKYAVQTYNSELRYFTFD